MSKLAPHLFASFCQVGSGRGYSCCPSPYPAWVACSCHVLSILSSGCLVISSVAASSTIPITGCSPLLIGCPQFQRPSLRHIYLPPSITSVQAAVILAAHHLIPPELPAPAIFSPSSFLCCPSSSAFFVWHLGWFPVLLLAYPVACSCLVLCWFSALGLYKIPSVAWCTGASPLHRQAQQHHQP